VYLVSNLFVRGLSIVLTPLYTRVMAPEHFAVVSIANTLTSVLGIVLGMALYGCIPRLYYDHGSEASRRRFLGTLTTFSIVFPVTVGVVLEVLGSLDLLSEVAGMPFRPHLELVIWTAVLSNLLNLPVQVYLTLEQPRRVALLNIGAGAAQLALCILLVAVLRGGALGVLRANCGSAFLSAVVAVALMFRMSDVTLSWRELRAALRYCLPLVPHLLATWALSVSDRLVLVRYVPAADIGCYSLGYLLSTGVSMVAGAVVTPINPAASRQLGDPETAKNIPPLGTYALFITIVVALLVAVNARELISLLAPPEYAMAGSLVPWLVAGAALQAFYLVWSTGTWYSKKTGAVPFITIGSVAVNVGLNLALVPRFGVMVSAVATAVAYAILAVLHGLLAQKNHPIPWDYRRWTAMGGAALASYALVERIAVDNVFGALLLKSLAGVGAFGIGLVLFGFVRREDLLALSGIVSKPRQ